MEEKDGCVGMVHMARKRGGPYRCGKPIKENGLCHAHVSGLKRSKTLKIKMAEKFKKVN